MTFESVVKYNSNVIHLCAWYNNILLLEDLEAYLNEKDKHYVNRLDLVSIYTITFITYYLIMNKFILFAFMP